MWRQLLRLVAPFPLVENVLRTRRWSWVCSFLESLSFLDRPTILTQFWNPSLRSKAFFIGNFVFDFVYRRRHSRAFSILFFQILGPFERAKYYAIWSLTEVGCVLQLANLVWIIFVHRVLVSSLVWVSLTSWMVYHNGMVQPTSRSGRSNSHPTLKSFLTPGIWRPMYGSGNAFTSAWRQKGRNPAMPAVWSPSWQAPYG